MSRVAYVIGQPISHSLSPVLFSTLAKHLGLSLSYFAKEISPEALGEFVKVQRETSDFLGCNVTLPHKTKILLYLDMLSDEAKLSQAVNVVSRKSGKLQGDNTDIQGIEFCLKPYLTQNTTALIYGAGGAARAAAFALGKAGVKKVRILNRTKAKAEAICQTFANYFPKTAFEVVDTAIPSNLYVQATSLGLAENDSCPELPKVLSSSAVAFDLVYSPGKTAFLKQAEARSLKTIDGRNLLVAQALATWEIWFGEIEEKEPAIRNGRSAGQSRTLPST